MVAEDNAINSKLVRLQLLALGHTPVIVSGVQALLDEIHAVNYDLIFMDCQMPGMSGYSVTAEIRRLESENPALPRTPIIAVTANAIEGDRERCLAVGMNDYISKPLEISELTSVISAHLNPMV